MAFACRDSRTPPTPMHSTHHEQLCLPLLASRTHLLLTPTRPPRPPAHSASHPPHRHPHRMCTDAVRCLPVERAALPGLGLGLGLGPVERAARGRSEGSMSAVRSAAAWRGTPHCNAPRAAVGVVRPPLRVRARAGRTTRRHGRRAPGPPVSLDGDAPERLIKSKTTGGSRARRLRCGFG